MNVLIVSERQLYSIVAQALHTTTALYGRAANLLRTTSPVEKEKRSRGKGRRETKEREVGRGNRRPKLLRTSRAAFTVLPTTTTQESQRRRLGCTAALGSKADDCSEAAAAAENLAVLYVLPGPENADQPYSAGSHLLPLQAIKAGFTRVGGSPYPIKANEYAGGRG